VVGKFAREAAATLLRFSKSTSDPELAARLVEKAADIKDRTEGLSSPKIDLSPWAPDIEPEGSMLTDLVAKAQKYESKAAQHHELALQALEGHQRAFFETLAVYYEDLAIDFRKVIAKRNHA
jgi:hypothetical protein